MIDNLIHQLQREARNAGKTLIIISEDVFVMEGEGKNIAQAIGSSLEPLMVSSQEGAARPFVVGCGLVLYAAAIAGLLGDSELSMLAEALAVARAHKKGGEN